MQADNADTRRLVSAARFARASLSYSHLLALTRRRVQNPICVHLRHQQPAPDLIRGAFAFSLSFFLV